MMHDDEPANDEMLVRLCWAQLECKVRQALDMLRAEGATKEQILKVLPELSQMLARAFLNSLAASRVANDCDHPALRSRH